jgi:Lipopolysaccharide kinase (Kdo/WaaP) family
MYPTDELIAVTARHSVRLAAEYMTLVHRPAARDFVVRTIAKREANGMPLMSADIVVAGKETREQFPEAAKYPLHFRKTYYPGRLHGEPKIEFDRQADAAALIGVPAPIGFTSESFRACLLPGTPFHRLTPFAVDPEERAIERARALPLVAAAGLFRLAEDAFRCLVTLHEGGLAHGDAELHNIVVCPSPLEALLIDFEAAVRRDTVTSERWETTCAEDFRPLLREAILLECALGQQPGPLAEAAWKRAGALFKNPAQFQREIDQKTTRPP